jgi:hypothetical protein
MDNERIALVLGHSFVGHMEKYIVSKNGSTNLFLSEFSKIVFRGIPGASIDDLWYEINYIKSLKPVAVVLDIGSNDLSNNCTAEWVVQEILRYARHLILEVCVRSVSIMQIYPRGNNCNHRYYCTFPKYNNAAYRANGYMQKLLKRSKSSVDKFIFMYKLRNMWENYTKYISDDGVHLNDQGKLRYYYNYRRALISCTKIMKNF